MHILEQIEFQVNKNGSRGGGAAQAAVRCNPQTSQGILPPAAENTIFAFNEVRWRHFPPCEVSWSPFTEFDWNVHRYAGLISQEGAERSEKPCLFPRFLRKQYAARCD